MSQSVPEFGLVVAMLSVGPQMEPTEEPTVVKFGCPEAEAGLLLVVSEPAGENLIPDLSCWSRQTSGYVMHHLGVGVEFDEQRLVAGREFAKHHPLGTQQRGHDCKLAAPYSEHLRERLAVTPLASVAGCGSVANSGCRLCFHWSDRDRVFGGEVKVVRTTVLSVVVLALLTACGDSDSNAAAEEQVCSAQSALSASVDQVAEDLKSLNLGQARDDWQTVQDDAAELSAAVQELASDRRDEIQPQVDELRSTVSSVTDATSLEELGSTLDTAEQQLSQIVTTITTSLDCPTS